jgi:hypothetical protein
MNESCFCETQANHENGRNVSVKSEGTMAISEK